ncbi:hypothetical protein T439DRAFT_326186 [Meredithblackwellia eburnea MCA 4105]
MPFPFLAFANSSRACCFCCFGRGWLVHIVLWGGIASLVASYTGTEQYARDSKWTKIAMWAAVLLDTAAASVNFVEAYHYGVTQKRDADSLFLILTMDGMPPVLAGSCQAIVQAFLATRAARLFQRQKRTRWAFLGTVGFFIFMGWLSSIGATIMFIMYDIGKGAQILPFSFNILSGTWMWCCAASDVCITSALIISLRKHIAGFNNVTDSRVRRVMSAAWKTASITTFLGVIGAICGVAFPITELATSDILFAFMGPLPALYVISLMVNLSSTTQQTSRGSPTSGAGSGFVPGRRASEMMASSLGVRSGVAINVDLSIISEREEDDWELEEQKRRNSYISV